MTAVMPMVRFESEASGREGAASPELVSDLERLVERATALRRYFEITGGLPAPGSLHAVSSNGESSASAAFRREGDFWTLVFEGKTIRLRDIAGLRYLAALLANAGSELAALEIARLVREGCDDSGAVDLGDG